MRKSVREKLSEAKRKAANTDSSQVQMTLEGILLLMLDGHRAPDERLMTPTQRRFIYSPSRYKAYKGPAGVAKTSTIAAAGLIRSLFQPGSKGMVARHDYNDLMDTTALRMQEMIDRLPKGMLLDRDKSPPMKWWIRTIEYEAEDGQYLDAPSQITFMGLKESLGSYEFDWAIVDEADEIEEKRAHEITTRLRNPAGERFGRTAMFAFNPPDKSHWLYTACTGRDHQDRLIAEPWMELFEPIPNENSRNLPAGYHDELAKNLPEDMKARLIRGEWGGTFPGQPVYREFKVGMHTKHLENDFDPYSVLYRFWDFGYNNPACLFTQMTHRGHLKVFREFIKEKIEITPFIQQVKAKTAEWFPDVQSIRDIGDPAARQKKDTGSTLAELLKEGIRLTYQLVGLDEGTRIVRNMLSQLVDGEPLIQIDSRFAPVLVAALRGGYHLDERTGTKAVKDGYYEHVADAFRYGVVDLFRSHGIDIRQFPSSIRYKRN